MKYTLFHRDRTERSEGISLSCLWWTGPLVVAASVAANAVVREVALRIFGVSPAFHHLMWGHLISVTVIAVSGAVIVFAAVARYAPCPIRLYWRLAGVVLVLSLLPDVAMIFEAGTGHSLTAVGSLMVMHGVDAAICVGMLTTLTRY